MKKTTNNTKKNTNYVNTAEIGNKLHKHLAERARLQQKQDQIWAYIKRTQCNRTSEMEKIDAQIGANTHEIDKLIGQLIRAGWHSGKAHSMAIGYLKSEIARNQRIASYRENHIKKVARGESYWVSSTGKTHTDNASQIAYVAKKKKKIALHQKMLSQLLAMQWRAA